MEEESAKLHLSVDCTVFGFDGNRLQVLLIRRTGVIGGMEFHDMKLPGDLIRGAEELDDTARRVLTELTGLKNVHLRQFHAFGSMDRTRDPKDVHWLEFAHQAHVKRVVTIAYLALMKIGKATLGEMEGTEAVWVPLDRVPGLAFDHNKIIDLGLKYLQHFASMEPAFLYDLLPRKFTVTQLRNLYEVVFGKKLDPANFYKKMTQMPYLAPMDEYEQGVSHRAARYYRFDKTLYHKTRL